MRPRWESLQAVAETAEQAPVRPQSIPPNRVSARSTSPATPPPDVVRPDTDEEAELLDEEARKTPGWLFALQMIVLVLVVAVLGVLVYLFATGDLFGEDAGSAATAIAPIWVASPTGP
ncbi:MAG TPA: hypothetical protein VK063_12695 [Beutenbergiaceae bacterium]|nr:hypothetical protein [Beutenbergiaceae bacterium]